jgi:post-segregation antitoxin (ccd killing protein)
MIDLKKHTKKKAKIETTRKVISVNIELKHKKFLKDNGLNLSSIVREIIDKMIEESKKEIGT